MLAVFLYQPSFMIRASKQAGCVGGMPDSAQCVGESGFVCEVDSVSMGQWLYMYLC